MACSAFFVYLGIEEMRIKSLVYSLFVVVMGLCMALRPASAVERRGSVDITLAGPANGNPFIDVELTAQWRVSVNNTYHLANADGTPFWQVGIALPGRPYMAIRLVRVP